MCKGSTIIFVIEPVNPTSMAITTTGLDIISPMPAAQENLKYVVVAIEYFSKWTEAKALDIITLAMIQKIYYKNIICRFRVPKSLTVDTKTRFDFEAFISFCNQVGTSIYFASVKFLESNGLVERANGIILLGVTMSLFGLLMGKWLEELIKVVWNCNTSMSRLTGFTPFKLFRN